MNTDQTVEHRRAWTHSPDRVRVEEAGDGLFSIRMPLASTAEARDGRALERDVIEGWREQIEAEPLPLFLDHGHGDLTQHRYGQLGRIGYWDNPETVERDNGVVDLVADATVVDPDSLDDGAGHYREALSWLRTQAELLPMASSAGWSEDTGDRDVPGGYDLMEGSLVGIPSDERTTTASADPMALARAVDAASEGFDTEAFLRALNANDDIMTDDDTPADDAGDETEENREEKDKYDRLMDRMDEIRDMNERELEMLESMASYDEDDDSEDDDSEDGDEEENADEPDEENEADDDADGVDEKSRSTVTIDGEEVDADEALDRLRQAAADDPETDEPKTRDVGEDADSETDGEGEGAAADETRDGDADGENEPTFSFS